MQSTAFVAPFLAARPGALPCSRRAVSAHHLTAQPRRRSRATQTAVVDGPGRGDRVIDGPFPGHYGQWSLTQADVDGVLAYRASLAVSAAAAAVAVVLLAAGGEGALREQGVLFDLLYFVGIAGFGASLQYIHIYIKPAHDALKAVFGAGAALSLVMALVFAIQNGVGGFVEAVATQPALMLGVGWVFVAATGLFFKEAVCFGRTEAIVLGLLGPVLSGGHFLGVLDPSFERAGCAAFAATYAFFATRKFMQDPKDDLGDKSVFDHLARGGSLGGN